MRRLALSQTSLANEMARIAVMQVRPYAGGKAAALIVRKKYGTAQYAIGPGYNAT